MTQSSLRPIIFARIGKVVKDSQIVEQEEMLKISEGGSYLASAGVPMYNAAKHGRVDLMRAMKPELVKPNIAISAIAPILRVNRELKVFKVK